MKKFCTSRNLKLLSYVFVVLYCISVSSDTHNSFMIIVRIFALTILFALFFIIDLDIFKRNIYKNTKRSTIVAAVFALVSYVMDNEGFYWLVYIGSLLLMLQGAFFYIKSQFSVRLFFERCGQFFLFSILMMIWWNIVFDFPVDRNLLIFDGVEIIFLSAVGFAYFWTLDTFLMKQQLN